MRTRLRRLAATSIGGVALLSAGIAFAQDAGTPAKDSTVRASSPSASSPADTASPAETEARKQREAAQRIRLDAGYLSISSRRFVDAERQFADLVSEIEAEPRKPDTDYYCALSQAETLTYLLKAAANPQSKRDAVVLSSVLCQAMYGRAYALVELRRIPEARDTLERLLRMAPYNAQFLIEYGNLLSRLREPAKALPLFKLAEDNASLMPEGSQATWVATALRSQGYALVELGRLDEAEAAYVKSLQSAPGHRGALAEIEYIRGRKNGTVKP